MFEVIQSDHFQKWLSVLKDRRAKARIHTRLDRMAEGHFGDVKSLGNKLVEARIDYGPGYRLYFMREGLSVILLLVGGDKRTQQRDIDRAYAIMEIWRQ